MPPARVTILYRRLPDRVQSFEQLLVEDAGSHVVTLLEAAPLRAPVMVGGEVVLEPGAPVVWFTYPGAWHDVGRFHRADGTFTGYYANVLTPVEMDGLRWETTDLALDVWAGADGRVEVLDRDEFDAARARGWLDEATAERALREAETLAAAAREGAWPPEHVREWDLRRARGRAAGADTQTTDPSSTGATR